MHSNTDPLYVNICTKLYHAKCICDGCKSVLVVSESLRRSFYTYKIVQAREEVFMEGPIEPNMGPSLADVLLCRFASTNPGFSSFPVRKLLSRE